MPAYSQYSGYYGELFYGSGDTQFKFFSDIPKFDSDSDFVCITVGRRFNDNLAAEVSYVDHGESEASIANTIVTLDGVIESKAFSISAIGSYPFNRNWTLFGKFGLNQWSLDASITDVRFIPSLTLSGDDRGTGINFGAGVEYRFTPSYSIRLEYLTYLLNSGLFEDDVAVNGATVALRYNY